jgi:hypothetical protein
MGLAGPFITEATRHALAIKLDSGVRQPLAAISLRSNSFRADTSDAAIMSLGIAFLDQNLGTGAVERLIPAMGNSTTLGEAIHTAIQVDPATLESAWQNYLQDIMSSWIAGQERDLSRETADRDTVGMTMKNVGAAHFVSVILVVSVLLSACGGQPQPALVADSASTPDPTATSTPAPVLLSPTDTPTETPTGTATPTPVPPNPLSVEYMRKQDYAGSDIVIEQTLAPGANYNQYIASYKSDGLKIYALLTVPMGPEPRTGWPAIVFNHGSIPPAQYETKYVAYGDAFAAAYRLQVGLSRTWKLRRPGDGRIWISGLHD